MALTEEELLLQMNILATKTSDNPNMVYKSNATLNKGLNPDYFSGNSTKLVNAINSLAAGAQVTETVSKDVAAQLNTILLDIQATDNKPIWEHVQSLMEKPTIIEGLEDILTGKHQDKILGLNIDDIGKILTVGQDEDGNPTIKAIDAILSGGPVSAENIVYNNDKHPEISNMKDAVDFLFDNNSGGGVVVPGDISWEDIQDKPEIPNELSISDNKLYLQNENGTLSSVDLTVDSDIDSIVENLN